MALVSLRDLAFRLGVSYATVYRLARAGVIPVLRVGGQYRADPEAVIEALSAQIREQSRESLDSALITRLDRAE